MFNVNDAVYRIYTEDVNASAVEITMSNFFDSYTVAPARGFWQGNGEDSVIIEVIANPTDVVHGAGRTMTVEEAINWTAIEIARNLGQEAVLVTKTPVEYKLVLNPDIDHTGHTHD